MIEKPTSESRDKAISMSKPRGIALLLAMIVTAWVVTKCNISRFLDSSKSNSKKDLQELFTPSADDTRWVKQEVKQYDPFDSHWKPSCIIIPDRILPPTDKQINNTGPEQGKEMLREASEQETPQQKKPTDTIDPN